VPDCPGQHHRHRFPAAVIAHAVWLYHRFALRLRDVEELLFERGIRVTYETIRAWVAKFGARYAGELQKRAARPGRTWHLDGVVTRMGGKQVYLGRAVDEHGQLLDVLAQERRDTEAAERFLRRLVNHADGPPARPSRSAPTAWEAMGPRRRGSRNCQPSSTGASVRPPG
jgi:putative transposase